MSTEELITDASEAKTQVLRLRFNAWHAKRADGIYKRADSLSAEMINNGFQDSPGTRQAALYKALEEVDGTGFDAWLAGACAERSLPFDFSAIQESLLKNYGSQATTCVAEIARLTGNSLVETNVKSI